jgi:hypothetical protein
LIVSIATFNRDILALAKAGFLEPLAECRHEVHRGRVRRAAQKANHRHGRLRACGKR